ncbi:MAG TPA: hypothetical protein VF768_04080, partial [Holophagaceae bacterium]
ANTDAEAFGHMLSNLPPGPVLVLGSGGVARTTLSVLEAGGRKALQAHRRIPLTPSAVGAFAPVGVVQATSLGMEPGDPLPFPELLESARPTLRWGAEWIYKEDTAFSAWIREAGFALVAGETLFQAQAEAQSRRFIQGCGGTDRR